MSELATAQATVEAGPLEAAHRVMTMVLEGEIGRAEVADVEAMLERLTEQGVRQVVVDLKQVTHLDYRCVQPLADWANQLRELGGDVRLAGVSPYLLAIVRSAGANDAFDFYATQKDARGSFDRGLFAQGG